MTRYAEPVDTGIGQAFSYDLNTNGLLGLAISWSSKGINDTVWYYDEGHPGIDNGLTSAQITTLLAVIDNHNSLATPPPDDDEIMRQYVVTYAEAFKLVREFID